MSFGSSAPQIGYQPGGFRSPGISATRGAGGNYNIRESAALQQQIGSLQSTFGQQASDLAALRGTVAPGLSQFRQAGLSDIATQGQANVSNLRDQLAQRRVLGSSFANSQISQANADIEKQRTDFIAKSYLEELSASNQLIQEQYQASANQFQVGINQMNFEAGLAAQLTQSANQVSGNIAMAQAKLDQESAMANAAGIGKAIGYGASMGTSMFMPSPSYGGGNFLTDAYGGSSSNPLPGLGPEDYGPGF
jgi:hypothetical protein